MPTIEHNGKTFQVDDDGCLVNLGDWNADWVDYVRLQEGIAELTDEHRKINDILQEYLKKNGITPQLRLMSKTTGFPMNRMYDLYPLSRNKGACMMAGTPKPRC